MSDTSLAATEQVPTKWVMKQMPEADIVGESPLHHVGLERIAQQGPQDGGVYFREHKLMGLLTLRCTPSPEQQQIMTVLLGVALPMQPLTSVIGEEIAVYWVSPDEWLIKVAGNKAFALETRFHDQMTGHFSLVNVSGGLTVFEVSGDQVVNMLKKSTPVDLHSSEFPIGKVVSTVFAKSGAIICRLDDKRFELVVRRSFADYLWLWIQDASREYGLVVEV